MSDASSVDVILSQVGEREKEYDWLGATEPCNKALGLVTETDFFKLGQVQERLGYAFYRSALQAESVEQFRGRMREALAVYEKAKGLYLEMNEPAKTPRILRCDAMIQHIGYWLASEVTEKKRLLDECWRLTKEALKAFEEVGEAWEYGKAYNQLSISADLGYFFESNCRKREKTMREAVEHGERTINLLSTTGDHFELARAYMKTATYVEIFGYYFADIDEKEKCFQKAVSCVLKANEFSEEAAMLELSSVLFGMGPGGYWGDGTEDSLSNFNKALDYGGKTKDKFIVGRALDLLAYHTFWKSLAAGDPDERVKLAKTALKYAEEAKHAYSHISFTSPRGGVIWSGAPYAQHFQALAYREIDLGKKRELLEKAMEAAPVLIKLAGGSGYVDILGYAHAIFGMILRDLARIEANSEERKRLFERALVHGSESTKITEQVEPFAYYNLGLWHGFLADIRSELAKLTEGTETKKNMLQEAVTDLEDSWRFAIKGLPPPDREARSPISLQVGALQYITGSLLVRLHELTNNKEHLRKAIEYFKEGA